MEILNNPALQPWLPLAAFVAIGLLVAALGQLLIRVGRSRRAEDLDRMSPLVFGPFTVGLAGVLPLSAENRAELRRDLHRAGYYRPLASEQFLAIRNALVFGWIVLTLLVLLIAYQPTNDPTVPIMVVGVAFLALLFSLPRLYLQAQARARVKRIETQLPDGLDMITMCLTGGLSLHQALERVTDELHTSHADLALELCIIRRHAQTHSLESALEQFARRIDVPEIQSLAALVSQTERLGANVATALRDYADGIRLAFRQRAEERGNRSSVAMMLPVALCLAPPVYILLLAPAVMELREFVIRENRPGGVLRPSAETEQFAIPSIGGDAPS